VFGEKVNEALARVKRGDTLTVFFVDLDNFKTINDTPGSLCWRCAPQGSRAASAGLLREIDTVRGSAATSSPCCYTVSTGARRASSPIASFRAFARLTESTGTRS